MISRQPQDYLSPFYGSDRIGYDAIYSPLGDHRQLRAPITTRADA